MLMVRRRYWLAWGLAVVGFIGSFLMGVPGPSRISWTTWVNGHETHGTQTFGSPGVLGAVSHVTSHPS